MRRAGWLALGGFALTCRVWPAFSRGWMTRVAQPALLALHRWTGRIPFPVLEPLALIALGALLTRPRRWGRTLGLAAALYLLLWFPARTLPARHAAGEISPARLVRLCDELVDALNASPLDFPPVSATLALTGAGVKAARWPEWMRLFRASGLFMPLTGEALLDPTQPKALAPFTARHELAHLSGVADEGEANIRAWQVCAELGGFWADSARLWALRYAVGLLPEEDACRMMERMNHRVRACFAEAGGPLPAEGRDGNYRDLVDWLAASADVSCNRPASFRGFISSVFANSHGLAYQDKCYRAHSQFSINRLSPGPRPEAFTPAAVTTGISATVRPSTSTRTLPTR